MLEYVYNTFTRLSVPRISGEPCLQEIWDLECVAVEISRSYRMFFNFLISLLHMNEGGAGNSISYDTLSENTCEISTDVAVLTNKCAKNSAQK